MASYFIVTETKDSYQVVYYLRSCERKLEIPKSEFAGNPDFVSENSILSCIQDKINTYFNCSGVIDIKMDESVRDSIKLIAEENWKKYNGN